METKKLTVPSFFIISLFLISLTSPISINNPNLPLVSRQETTSTNGSNDWNDLINVPAGFADNVDDVGGVGSDGNNYTYGLNVTGGSTKTINIFVSGGPNVSTTFTDNDADTDTWSTNTSAYLTRTQILGLNYWNDTYATFNKSYADTLYYSISNPSNFITDGNTNWDNSYNFTTNESCTAFINSTGLVKNWSISEVDTLQTVMTRGNTTAKYMTITDTGSGRIDGAGYLSIFNNGSGNTEFALAIKQQNTDYNAQYIWYNGSDFALGIDNWGYDGTETGGLLIDSFNQSDYGILTRTNTGSSSVPLTIENDGSGNDINAPNMTLNDGVLVLGSSTFSGTKYISIGNSTKYIRLAATPTTTVLSTLDSVLEIKGATGTVYFDAASVNNTIRLRNSSGTDSVIGPLNGGISITGTITSPTLAVASCDVKTHSGNGTLYCGTDETSSITDTNETGRFNNLTNTDCSVGQVVLGVQSNGTVLCTTDIDTDTDTWNTTEEMQDANGVMVNGSLDYDDANAKLFVNRTWVTDLITSYSYITDGNTNWDNSYGFITWANAVNGTLALASDLANYVQIANIVNLVGNWTLDKPNYANWSNSTSTFLLKTEWNATNTSYYLASNPSGYITNATMNKTVSCSSITGADVDFCVDSEGSGADTNETSRFNNLTNTDCSAGTLVIGVQSNGTVLCATDSTGTGGGLTEWFNKTIANVNTTSSTAYSNLTGLRTTLSANTNYSILCNIIDRSGIATTGIQLRINSSGTPTEVTWVFGSTTSATAYTTVSGTSTSQNALADTGSSGSNIRANSMLTGYIQTGANPVVLDYGMKAEVSASWAMVDKGSTCRYTVIT